MKEQETRNNNINTDLPGYEDFTEYDEDYDGDGEIDSYEEVRDRKSTRLNSSHL